MVYIPNSYLTHTHSVAVSSLRTLDVEDQTVELFFSNDYVHVFYNDLTYELNIFRFSKSNANCFQ